MEEGCCQPKLEPSLLGLEWDCFSTYKFPQGWQDPPEFAPIAFSILDAYAAAILASGFEFEAEEPVSLGAQLTRIMLDGPTTIELWMNAERWPLNTHDHNPEIYSAFREFLTVRQFEEEKTKFAWMEGPGCRLYIGYPGQMVSQKSPFLRNRWGDDWPRATLKLRVTDAMKGRAREVLAFLRATPSSDANVH